jgi:hypothetical protein
MGEFMWSPVISRIAAWGIVEPSMLTDSSGYVASWRNAGVAERSISNRMRKYEFYPVY